MIPEPHDQERLVGKFARETRLEARVVVHAHLLAAQIFVDLERISWIHPAGKEVGTPAEIPWRMVHREVNEDEYRATIVIVRDHSRRIIVKKAVGIRGPVAASGISARHVMHLYGIEEMHDAGGCVEATRIQESAEPGTEAIGAI